MAGFLHAGCAAIYGVLAALILLRGRLSRTGLTLAGACLVTAAWAGVSAMTQGPAMAGIGGALELARAIAWYGFVLHLYRKSVSGQSPSGRVFGWLGLGAGLLAALTLLGEVAPLAQPVSLGSLDIDARLALAVCTLLLIENLYRNAPEDLHWHIALPCVAIGGLFVYDIVLYADTVLFRRLSPILLDGRAVVTALVAPLLAVSAARNRRWGIDIHVSRTVAFHSATLVVSGVFLLGLAAAGEVFRRFGADWGLVAEISLIFGGAIGVGVLLTSGSARSRLRALLIDHFYSHRYDYRHEWMRCIATLSGAEVYVPLHTRVIRALAQIVDSPGGLLFLRDAGERAFRWTGSWNLPSAAAIPPDHALLPLLGDGAAVVVADAAASWVEGVPGLWLAVPLSEGGRLSGFVLLARSRAAFKLDREVFDLLRTVGQEVAVFVAEQRAAQGLLETQQLREYGQRFAFVAHDIKNVSSQLSLLLANAEHHLDNPEFQRDMLRTLRASVQKIGGLLARLQTPQDSAGQDGGEPVLPLERLQAIVAAQLNVPPVRLEHDGREGRIAMRPTAFDAVIAHLLDNAVEASAEGEAVRIRLRHEARRVLIDIVDHGSGMTPEFIRDRLFQPFRSSKRGGFGIGVYQARELVREAGGDLLVLSRPGLGTTMRLLLPLAGVPADQAASLSA